MDRNEGYVVKTKDGKSFEVKNIDEAIKLKKQIQKESKWMFLMKL